MDHILHFWNIKTARGQISRNKYGSTAVTEMRQGTFTFRLLHSSVEVFVIYTHFGQIVAHPFYRLPIIAEDKGRTTFQFT